MDGTLLDKWEIPTRKEENGDLIIPDVIASIQKKLTSEDIAPQQLKGIGVCSPGIVSEEGIVCKAVNLGWKEVNIPRLIQESLNLPVKVGNDAKTATLGELWAGGGKGYDNLVMITLGTGVGGGIIVNRQIINGATGAAGEIGHMHINDAEEVTCGCGCKGCLEQYASATGITKLAIKRLEKDDTPSVLRRCDSITAKEVFDAAKAQDAVALEIADEFGKYLGTALAMVSAIVNPKAIVIGGGVSKAGEILFDYLRPYFIKNTFSSIRNVDFKLATLGNDAGIYGAASMIIN